MVSQAFCSALPAAYTRVPPPRWEAFASLVLQAAYEATMWAAVHNAQRGASNVVLLTSLGGGAFRNDESWIHAAMRRALKMVLGCYLDVKLVSYGPHRGRYCKWQMMLAEIHAAWATDHCSSHSACSFRALQPGKHAGS